jgi:hypothetical protein
VVTSSNLSCEPISLGDLVRALSVLAPEDEAARRAITQRLGFELTEIASSDTPAADAQPSVAKQHPLAEPAAEASLRERQYKLTRLPSRASRIQTIALPSTNELPVGVAEDALPRPPLEPLLRPTWSRAVVATLAKRNGPRGRLDVPKLVAFAAKQHQPRKLPIVPNQIASGADVLVDIGTAMQVFGRDQQHAIDEIRRVLGKGQVPVFRFTGSPMRGVTDDRRREHACYRTRGPGWPIVLLTDLGIGAEILEQPTRREWSALAALARAQGSRLVALVPYPRERWRNNVPRSMTIIPWDRNTTARAARAALRRSAR